MSPDFTKDMPPDTPDNFVKGKGTDALGGAQPFTLHPDGVGWLYVAERIEGWSAAHAL